MTRPHHRRGRLVVLGVAAIAMLLAGCCAIPAAAWFFLSAGQDDAALAACPTGPAVLPTTSSSTSGDLPGSITTVGADGVRVTWDAEQVNNAAVILAVGRQKAVPTRGWVIAEATAMQESRLRNLPEGDRDSIGLFQQRPSMNWGEPPQLRDRRYAAGQFYDHLIRIKNWQRGRLTDVAQAVQSSATPEAYQKWEPHAEQLVARLAGVKDVDDLGGGEPGAPCGTDNLGGVPVPAGRWIQPVNAPVGSGFRPPDRPGHNGVDLIAARYTPIRAASAGRVITVTCNSSIGTCDRDGSPAVKGCGWYVEILHAGGIVTRYCHMVSHPKVTEGQNIQGGEIIGLVGSSGNSSGPHLHFEWHAVGDGQHATNANAQDPVPRMREAGAPLGAGG